MGTLSPLEAATAASLAYEAKDNPGNIGTIAKATPGLYDKFDFEKLSKFDSRTGAFFKVKSGFGFVVKGKKGEFKDDVLVSIRGTDLKVDWLTDANIGLQVSSTGKIVHAGFNRTFKDIEQHLSNHVPSARKIHFCGHSLGGALANLGADWAVQKKGASANLYTFGAPRVGFQPFADRLSTSVGSKNIFRVHRTTDVVPMIPIWPFVHAPLRGQTISLSPQGFYTPGAAHGRLNYIKSVGDYHWASLLTPETPDTDPLKSDLFSIDGIKSLGSTALKLLGKAIAYILKAAGIVVQGAIITGFSILDMLSMALEKAAKVSAEIASWVKVLIEKIISITGAGIAKIGDLTANFIRWVFQLLMSSIQRMANLALIE